MTMETLLQFPLFQGMSNDDLMEVVGQTRFEFMKCGAGKVIVKSGEHCNELLFIAEGHFHTETFSDNRSYVLTEYMHAPFVIEPERLFGYSQRYTSTFTADDRCLFFSISKSDISKIIGSQFVFRLNVMNILSTEVQRQKDVLWRHSSGELSQCIVGFIRRRCRYPAGKKEIRITMKQLATELHAKRVNISQALNAMQSDGLLTLSRGKITIPVFETLLQSEKIAKKQ